MNYLLAVFAGQGCQHVSMGSQLLSQFPNTKLVFEQAEDTLKINLRSMCFNGPEHILKLTYNAQVAVFTVAIGYFRALQEQCGFCPKYYAGHSLGEYCGLVAADKLEFSDALKIIYQRGKLMQKACDVYFKDQTQGFMSAVIGMNYDDLNLLCEYVNNQFLQDKISICDYGEDNAKSDQIKVQIANINSSDQLVVSGAPNALISLKQLIKSDHQLFDQSRYQKPIKIISLKVSAPFHSCYMDYAQEQLAPLIDDLYFKTDNEDKKIIANVSGNIESPYLPGCLIEQITSPVQWLAIRKTAQSLGVKNYVEVGDSDVLTNMFAKDKNSCIEGERFISTRNIAASIKKLDYLLGNLM